MYLRIAFGEGFEVPAVVTVSEFFERLKGSLPLSSRVQVWKEEVYFETGLEFKGELVTRVPSGALAYWPPGKAVCLFAWANQPYGPVSHVGWFLGPKHYILGFEGDEEVTVDVLDAGRYSERSWSISSALQQAGFYAAPRLWEGVESVAGAYARHNFRVGFDIFIEDFGYIVESDPIYERDFTALDEALQYRMRRIVRSRVDTNEDGYVVLSEFASTPEGLLDAVHQVVRDYLKVAEAVWMVG